MTALELPASTGQCPEVAARSLTDQLRGALAVLADQLEIAANLYIEAYQLRAWAALGYPSWDAYLDAELGEVRARLSRAQRLPAVVSMTEAGMSNRAIGSVLGVSEGTVRADREQVRSSTHLLEEPVEVEVLEDVVAPPTTVLGTDGKTYLAASTAPARRRRPLPDQFRDATYDLTKVIGRVTRLGEDDRFLLHADTVARHRGDLVRARDALDEVLERLLSV
jgi:hypothetical protein